MNKTSTTILALALTWGGTTPASVSARDTATFDNYLPASSVTLQRYSCLDDSSGEVAVEFATTFSGPGERVSRLRFLTSEGNDLPRDLLDEINEMVGDDTVIGSATGCTSDGIRIAIQVFRPGLLDGDVCLADAYAYVYVYWDRKSKSFHLP